MGILCKNIHDLCSTWAGHSLKQQICGHHACSSVRLSCTAGLSCPAGSSLQTVSDLMQQSHGQEAGLPCWEQTYVRLARAFWAEACRALMNGWSAPQKPAN